MTFEFLETLEVFLLAVVVLGLAATGVPLMTGRGLFNFPKKPQERSDNRIVFLFDDDHLVDASPHARLLLNRGPESLNDWQKMKAQMSKRFAGLSDKLDLLDQSPIIAMQEIGGPASLIARKSGPKIRISVLEPGPGQSLASVDHSFILGASDLPTLRSAAEEAPYPVWKDDDSASVVWANKSYLALVRKKYPDQEELSWPLPKLFGDVPDKSVPGEPWRKRLDLPDAEAEWFDGHSRPAMEGHVNFAYPATAIVRAEDLLTSFLQTMTKTFADLPVGLAIFSRERQLTLFNPALTDLLGLDSAYLATRPSLMDFFDHLRENRKLPEPKDYKSWRHKVVQFGQKAQEGNLRETWTLEDGQTYRVTGRPHADGALALLIEDISTEVTLTRRFRHRLDQAQAVFDGLDQAIAVFSSSGMLTQTNGAYEQLWGPRVQNDPAERTIAVMTGHWRSRARPSPVWGEIRDFVTTVENRATWQDKIFLHDGRVVEVTCKPLAGNATMISFLAVGLREQIEPVDNTASLSSV